MIAAATGLPSRGDHAPFDRSALPDDDLDAFHCYAARDLDGFRFGDREPLGGHVDPVDVGVESAEYEASGAVSHGLLDTRVQRRPTFAMLLDGHYIVRDGATGPGSEDRSTDGSLATQDDRLVSGPGVHLIASQCGVAIEFHVEDVGPLFETHQVEVSRGIGDGTPFARVGGV